MKQASVNLFTCLAALFAVVVASLPVTPANAAEAGPRKTRFVVGLDRRADYQIHSLSNPHRVVIEIGEANLQLPTLPTSGPTGVVKSINGGRAGNGNSRIVIHLTEPSIVEKSDLFEVDSGFHLSLEIVPTDLANAKRALADAPFDQPYALGAAGITPPLPRAVGSIEQYEKQEAKFVIVLDPGHGGHDSGAKKNGAVEKDIVLAFAHTLRKKLEASGRYKILMTRETDEFIELGDRQKFAEKHNANLFVSIHADYASSSASGAAVFSLRPSVANKLKRNALRKASKIDVAKGRLKAVDKGDENVVEGILSDLARTDAEATTVRSDLFSKTVIRHMGKKTDFRQQPHRTAAFKVLKTHLIPSVLIELAFVTNKADAKRLKSQSWRDEVSSGIASAIDNYFSHHAARMPMLAGVN